MTLYKTIANKTGGVRVAMTADEESEFLAGQAASQAEQAKPPEPSDIEIRLAALEAKVGITEEDKEAAMSSLMTVNMGVKQ